MNRAHVDSLERACSRPLVEILTPTLSKRDKNACQPNVRPVDGTASIEILRPVRQTDKRVNVAQGLMGLHGPSGGS